MHRFRPFLFACLMLTLFFTSRAFAYQQIEFIREIGDYTKKAEQRQFNAPRSLARSGDRFYIADTDANRVVVLDRQSGKTVLSWGEKGGKPGQFKSPWGIAVNEQGRVYVSDTGNNRIQVFDAGGKWVRSFGDKGSGPREFSSPSGIAAARGLIYVADTGNSRVQILTYDGVFVNQIAVKTKKDKMRSPVDVAADVQNKIYVLDAGSNNVRVFDQAGVQIAMFGSKGKGTEGFDKPQGLAVNDRGEIYVADTGNCKLKKFDPQGRILGSIGSEGDDPGQFRAAAGLAVDEDGRVAVLDAEKNTLQIFACEPGDGKPLAPASPPPSVEFYKEMKGDVSALAEGKRVWGVSGDALVALGIYEGRTIGAPGSEPGLLKGPRGIAIDPGDNFWVADTGNDRLQKFSLEGNLLQVVGRSGSAEGEFRSPSAVAVGPKGTIIVADTGNARVQVFNARGMFLGAFGKSGKLPGQFGEPVDVAVDGAENIYVADRGNDRIAKYDGNGVLLWEAGKSGGMDGEFRGPENILVSPDGEVYVLDAGNARVQVFDTNGRFLRKFGSEGREAGEFRSPAGLALEDGIRLYVGDRGNGRVQVFTLRHTPAVPKDLSALARVNEIQISWKANTETYLEQYRIYRSDSPAGAFKPVGASIEPYYMDKGLPSNHAFRYFVTSQAKEGNESAASALVSAVTPKLMPAAPKKVKIDAREKELTLSWLPNAEPFMSHYRVYRSKQPSTGFEFLAKTDKTVFVDGPLADETFYYYQITAVGKEGDESPPSEVVFAATPRASLTVPPVEISKVEVGEVFAAAYKYYETHPIGKVTIRNNADKSFSGAKLNFSVKEFMDYPTEIEVKTIAPKQELTLDLKPVFNNRILEVTENTPLQSEITLTYYIAGEPRTVTRSFPVTLYERHAIRWDQKAKVGAFITPKDTVVTDFARSVVQPYVEAYPNLPQSLVYARALYGALGVLGVSYIVDPTPFQEFSENAAVVDYTQYPRDVLARKSGDCDDLSTLFAACLENIGIGAALVDVPGHVFIMFNTGVVEKDKASLGFPDPLIVAYQGTVWVPVEMTIVGSSFTRAWQKGAEEYRDWSAKGKVDVIDVEKAWEQFRPVPLPKADSAPIKVKREEIEAKFKGELETLARQRLTSLSTGYLESLKKNPNDLPALTQLGILYGENGLYAEALEQFQKMLLTDKDNAVALNNIGNINYLQGRLDDARQAYESALKSSAREPGIMVNLARVLYQSGKKEEARKRLQDAAAIDPRVLRQYDDLAAELGVVK